MSCASTFFKSFIKSHLCMIEYDVNVREYCNIVSSLSPNDCGTVTVRISHPCGIDGES